MRRRKDASGQSSAGRLMDSLSTLARAGAGAVAPRSTALPRPLQNSDQLWNRLTVALLLIAAALVLLTFRSYGVTWDEDMQRWYGDLVLDNYLSWVGLARKPHWLLLYSYGDLYNYGAVFDITASALNRVSPLGVFETRHLLNALVGLVGVAGAWKLGNRLGGARAGFLAALFLLLTPNYFGQMFNNPKDIPFAAGFIWATYYLVRIVPFLPRPPWRLVVKLAVATGLAMAVRIGGLLLVCYLGLMLVLFALWQGVAARRLAALTAAGWTSLWRVFVPVAIIAYALMLVFWPWAQSAPIAHPLSALAVFSHEIIPTKILFDGRLYTPGQVPWTYLPTYIGLALPELVMALLITAPIVACVAQARQRNWRADRILPLFMLGFTIVFPVAYAIAVNAVLFNGMRHFIFVLPPIAVSAALIADIAVRRLADLPYRTPIYAAL